MHKELPTCLLLSSDADEYASISRWMDGNVHCTNMTLLTNSLGIYTHTILEISCYHMGYYTVLFVDCSSHQVYCLRWVLPPLLS